MRDPRAKPVPAAWRTEIGSWAVWMRAGGLSPASITTRTDHLRRAARALGGVPWAVTSAKLLDWVGRQSWATETRRGVYASLRGFWRWGVESGRHVGEVPTARLPRVKAAPPAPRPAPDRVIERAKIGSDARVVLILRLAAELGLRRAEIAQVNSRDLFEDLDGWSLTVHGKGGRLRVVPMSPDLARAVIGACLAGGGWAFPGDDGGHLSARWVGKLATRALPGDWTLHTLRHRFATTTHDATLDLLSVSELLGHANTATTQRYVAVNRERLRRVARSAA